MTTKSGKKRNRQVAFRFQAEASPGTKEALGGKGFGLYELTRLGIPVPPGFTVTTSVARAFSQHADAPGRLVGQLAREIKQLERTTGKIFGDARNPLLVSVRSGAAVSMPGMMDTILNLGLNDHTIKGLAQLYSERFAWECYARFLAMFGEIVLAVPRENFHTIWEDHSQLSANRLRELCGYYKYAITRITGRTVPEDPVEQLHAAVQAVLLSWNNPRAKEYRKAQRISNDLGTAVTVQAMVFGNKDNHSGTGVVFSANVSTGEKGIYGEFLPEAQGEDVVAGTRTPMPISEMKKWSPEIFQQLDNIVRRLEEHRKAIVDIEFTIESGKLYILQVRNAKLSPVAAVVTAVHSVWEGRLTKAEAIASVSRQQVDSLQHPTFSTAALEQAVREGRLIGTGIPASQGIAVGTVVFTAQEAVTEAKLGHQVILVRPDTSPDDLQGMIAAAGIVTRTGGTTSHAAVVAREMGKPCIVGCTVAVSGGATISIDGAGGQVFAGELEAGNASAARKEVNLFLRWAAGNLTWPRPCLRMELIDQEHSVSRMINDYYLADAMASAYQATILAADAKKLRSVVHSEIAEVLATYLLVAVSGEIGHAGQQTRMIQSPEYDELTTAFGVRTFNYGGDSRKHMIPLMKTWSHEQQVKFLRLCEVVFAWPGWSSAFGGPRWAAIAKAAADFLEGKLSHSLFADHAFDLQHNGGRCFDKHVMLRCSLSNVSWQLDAKKTARGLANLFNALMEASREISAPVDSLLKKGREFKIW